MSAGLGQSESQVAEIVLQQVRGKLPEGLDGELTLQTSLYDVGLDSLARMDVVNSVEQAFGIRFSEAALWEMETCGDLVASVRQKIAAPGSAAASSQSPSAAAANPAAAEREVLPEHSDVRHFPECLAFRQRLSDTAAAGLVNPFFRIKQGVDRATATVAGQEVISYTSFDYLGLASDPRVADAARQAIARFGTSASASRLVGGNNTILNHLDEALAEFLGTEAAVIFPSGYGTNASLLGHLLGADDLILYDELAHNSIVQGSMLSQAGRRAFPHNDHAFVDKLLADVRRQYRRVVVAIEGVYSMDGDFPDLPAFLDVKRRHGALLYVDEAHSLGVLGAKGRGICEHFGVDPGEGDFWMGTISKALGSCGGYLAGREILIEYLRYTTPALVFATAASPANAAAALAALKCLRAEPQRVERLRDNAGLFLKLAQERGLNTGGSHDTPVIPIILGSSALCLHLSQKLLEQGIDAQPILYPAVPEAAARVRFFISADHTEEQITRTVELLAECLADITR